MKKPNYSETREFDGSFKAAIDSITNELKKQGFGILTTIDVKKILNKKIGVTYDPYVILGACSPTNAYNVLKKEKEIGLLLPCNVIVYERERKVYISIIKPTIALTLTGNTAIAEIAKNVEHGLMKALENATSNNI